MSETINKDLIRSFIISGKVQGVFFRDSTQRIARRLNIIGSATNQFDGTVKVIAKGSDESLAQLHQWLYVGPELAMVKNVYEVDIDQHLQLNEFIIA